MAAIIARLFVAFAALATSGTTSEPAVNHPASRGVSTSLVGSLAVGEASPASEGTTDDEAPETADRARVVEVGVWVLVGVLLLVGVVVTLLLMYGAHARRVARAPLPEQSRDDPFWYLRKAKASDPNEPDEPTQSDHESRPDP